MKKFIISIILPTLISAGISLQAQGQPNESLGLPGDNLNLYAVMNLFQESETLEGFEQNLNDPNRHINNLDLNGDNRVDYIRVYDNIDNDVHTIVLQVAINRMENQDVAVFTVLRYSNGQVQIQLIGDEALYGRDYIIEPFFDESDMAYTPNPGYTGNNPTFNGRTITVVRTSPYEIATWPVIRFIYMPTYVSWSSRWYYNHYPSYWRPWRPLFWDYYYGYQYNWYNQYYGHYHRSEIHRYTRWNDFYYSSRRAHSPNVSIRIREGNYKSTYSRPDQRRDGEALYNKLHSGQDTRRATPSSGTTSGRRSEANPSNNRQSSGTVTNRRSTSTVTKQPEQRQTTRQNTGASRQPGTTTTVRPDPKPTSVAPANSARRSTTRETTKTVAPSKTAKPASPAVNSSSRRSKATSSKETAVKKEKTTKAAEPEKPARRR